MCMMLPSFIERESICAMKEHLFHYVSAPAQTYRTFTNYCCGLGLLGTYV
jgi:hypothetical protein